MEDLNYYYANYSRIYNDVITLRVGSSYMYVVVPLSHILHLNNSTHLLKDEIILISRPFTVCQNITSTLHGVPLGRKLQDLMYNDQFEELITTTIEETKDIPEIISETGTIGMSHKGIFPRPRSLFKKPSN
jgi:uncharacterized Rmd1/YagE family protein